jgi:chitin disaccharide deacetylase
MAPNKFLIVNADDFGQSRGVNRGVIAAHENGIVTSASLMVRWPAATEAAAYARMHEKLSVGLHLDLAEWIYRDGEWVKLYEVVPVGDAAAITEEVSRQLTNFHRLLGRDPTHIDSHQHVHREEPVRSAVSGIADRLRIPLRHVSPAQYCGSFYGQSDRGKPFPDGISVENLIRCLSSFEEGVTEVACHPSAVNDLETMYGEERLQELKTLCDPRVPAALADFGIELISFHDFKVLSA